MKKLHALSLLILFTLQSSCLQELSHIISGGGDGSTSTIAEDGVQGNATQQNTEDTGIETDALEESGSESDSGNSDTNLDSEGFATLPVTPPKAINALSVFVTSGSDGSEGASLFSKSAYAQSFATHRTKCRLGGTPGAVEPDAELALIDIGSYSESEMAMFVTKVRFKAAPDGSFRINVPREMYGKGIGLSYANEEGNFNDQIVDIKIDKDCSHYTVGISQVSLDITGDLAVADDKVIYNKRVVSGENGIMMQAMNGNDAVLFAVTPTKLRQMHYFEAITRENVNVKRDEMIVGIDEYNNLVRVGPDGHYILNDDVKTDDIGESDEAEVVSHAPQSEGWFSVLFARDVEANSSSLTLVPTISSVSDITFNDFIKSNLKERTMTWINSKDLLCIDQLAGFSAKGMSAEDNTMSAITVFDMHNFTTLTEEELALMEESDIDMDIAPKMMLHSDYPLKRPEASSWKKYSSSPFLVFEVELGEKNKLGISDYSRAKILSNLPGSVVNKSLSQYGDVLAVQVGGGPDEQSNILIVHLPTMTHRWLINPDNFDNRMTIKAPVFSDNQPYALTYQMEIEGEGRQIGVINLLYHPFFKTVLSAEVPSFSIDHILESDDYMDLDLVEVNRPNGFADEN